MMIYVQNSLFTGLGSFVLLLRRFRSACGRDWAESLCHVSFRVSNIQLLLLQVMDALTGAALQREDDASIKTNPQDHESVNLNPHSTYPSLHTKLLVPHVVTPSGEVRLDARITFGDLYGAQAACDAACQLQMYKSFRPLYLFLRELLRQRELDKEKDGGLPPYILYCMVRYTVSSEVADTEKVQRTL